MGTGTNPQGRLMGTGTNPQPRRGRRLTRGGADGDRHQPATPTGTSAHDGRTGTGTNPQPPPPTGCPLTPEVSSPMWRRAAVAQEFRAPYGNGPRVFPLQWQRMGSRGADSSRLRPQEPRRSRALVASIAIEGSKPQGRCHFAHETPLRRTSDAAPQPKPPRPPRSPLSPGGWGMGPVPINHRGLGDGACPHQLSPSTTGGWGMGPVPINHLRQEHATPAGPETPRASPKRHPLGHPDREAPAEELPCC